MPRVRLSAGRSGVPSAPRVRFVGRRSAAVQAALTAAGEPIQPMYDTLYGSPADLLFKDAARAAGYTDLDRSSWPYEGTEFVAGLQGELFREGTSAVYKLPDGTLAYFAIDHGWAHLRVAGTGTQPCAEALAVFQSLYPATYLDATDERVPVTFWSLGPHGPMQRLRMVDASPWGGIRRNYTADVRDRLDALMDGFEPGRGGQLLLWQGPPGTGKTWALRALVSEWLPWAEFHVITDPDAFFVESASYMIEVLLAESYGAIDEPSGDVYDEADPLGKWRVLVLEDTGELLSARAKEKYGQGLSRLLNVVDGLIGQGLRVLVLVTTNDELGELNPAVRRPGRCASQIEFVPMTLAEAAEWLGIDPESVPEGTSLAELYDRAGASESAFEPKADPALTAATQPQPGAVRRPDSGWNTSTPREALAADEGDVVSRIRAVAEDHAPDGGYGETCWNADERSVFWVSADWTTNDELDAAERDFLAVEGVDGFEHEAEASPPRGDGWVQVWPEPGSELAYQRVLALASRPL